MSRRTWIVAGILLALTVVYIVMRPPRLLLNMTRQVEPSATVGEALVEECDCRDCHTIAGAGALKAPNLGGLVPRQMASDPALVSAHLWLRNPRAVKGSTAMPKFHLPDSEIDAIIAYLATLTE